MQLLNRDEAISRLFRITFKEIKPRKKKFRLFIPGTLKHFLWRKAAADLCLILVLSEHGLFSVSC